MVASPRRPLPSAAEVPVLDSSFMTCEIRIKRSFLRNYAASESIGDGNQDK